MRMVRKGWRRVAGVKRRPVRMVRESKLKLNLEIERDWWAGVRVFNTPENVCRTYVSR